MPSTVYYTVGNTHKHIPRSQAKLSREGGGEGRTLKQHDISIYVDILEGSNPDVIESVTFNLGSTFQPSSFVCSCPISVVAPDGNTVWRFQTRQSMYGAVTANIRLRGAGGSKVDASHTIILDGDGSNYRADRPYMFVERKPLRMSKPKSVANDAQFGIELELTSSSYIQPETIASHFRTHANLRLDVFRNHSDGYDTSFYWKLVPDSSISCNLSNPDCNKMELVSPPLQAGEGLSSIHNVLKNLGSFQNDLKVNKSAGFHVHIDVSNYTTAQITKICQQFVKYEDVFDTLMPPSRRSGSNESTQYFQSNRTSIEAQCYDASNATNRMVHDELQDCVDNLPGLIQLMNQQGRYYKLNLQNLATGRQPTIEFRQHSATINYEKVSSWVRFCILFCANSAKYKAPTPFTENSSLEKKFECLFQFVIKDRALKRFYAERQKVLYEEQSEDCDVCCEPCNTGGGSCSTTKSMHSAITERW